MGIPAQTISVTGGIAIGDPEIILFSLTHPSYHDPGGLLSSSRLSAMQSQGPWMIHGLSGLDCQTTGIREKPISSPQRLSNLFLIVLYGPGGFWGSWVTECHGNVGD
ncbi:hypothetical protein KIL84_004778 [Mauremys mutica]|uniref:Uncharacterized protein n=1 Tax=Mauremys mutica TaxID=74926 RepID=A0A9D4B785_9SAUR|nr:hypothetical protein KIL84_004778 [Mauremys mutica]